MFVSKYGFQKIQHMHFPDSQHSASFNVLRIMPQEMKLVKYS